MLVRNSRECAKASLPWSFRTGCWCKEGFTCERRALRETEASPPGARGPDDLSAGPLFGVLSVCVESGMGMEWLRCPPRPTPTSCQAVTARWAGL